MDKKRKRQHDDYADLVTVGIVAVISLIAYDKSAAISDATQALLYGVFFIGILLIMVVSGSLAFHSRRVKRQSGNTGTDAATPTLKLTWIGMFIQDLITYAVPLIFLILPIIFGQDTNINDMAQSLTAFIALKYLKWLYWGTII